MIKVFFVYVVSLIIFAGSIDAAQVSLRNGSRIQAPLLKKTGKSVVLDLGYDLLRVPPQDILDISDDAVVPLNTTTNEYYSTADSESLTTADASKKYGSAVVVVKSPHGLGSGFFVNKDGYLVTNFHVIKGSRHLTVTRFKLTGSTLKRIIHRDVEIVAVAPFHDLAVLKVNDMKDDYTTVVIAKDDNVTVGETVFTIGNPLGLERSVTEGVISQAERSFGGFLYHQVDAPINPGNSGGPLFNSRGQVIGVVNMGADGMEGLNFAIPVQHVKYVLNHLSGFAFDQSNSESGYVYPDPPPRPKKQNSK
jgi:serine protease Do